MKNLDLFFGIVLCLLCGLLTACCAVSAIVYLAWWQLLFAIMGCGMTWLLCRSVITEYRNEK